MVFYIIETVLLNIFNNLYNNELSYIYKYLFVNIILIMSVSINTT